LEPHNFVISIYYNNEKGYLILTYENHALCAIFQAETSTLLQKWATYPS
jgi:hypothetical protein